MNKQELIEATEKAKLQTRGQAARVIDMLSGVRSDPFAKNETEKQIRPKRLVPESDKDEGKATPDLD